MLAEAGIGLRAAHRIGSTDFITRFDFPIYVSEASLAQDDGPGSDTTIAYGTNVTVQGTNSSVDVNNVSTNTGNAIALGTLAIGEAGAANAGILAAEILATSDDELAGRLRMMREGMAAKVLAG